MTLTLTSTREQVVAEALSWKGTKYHLGGRVKGAGIDCGTFLLQTYIACGLVPETAEIEKYTSDWFCHTKEEKYLRHLVRHAYKVAEAVSFRTLKALPGNMVLTHCANSKVFNHGGIVIEWPRVIHAVYPAVGIVDASTHWMWANRIVVVLDPWEKPH